MTIDWEHVARKQLHPLKQRILDHLISLAPTAHVSPKELATILGSGLEITSYHCRAMCKQGLLELVHEGAGPGTRGAVRHIYRLHPSILR